MIASVSPTSSGFGGGSYNSAATPTGVAGAFASPGSTSSTPPGVPSSGIIEARNNRGSNVTIPYARLVPMHKTVNALDKTDKRIVKVDGKPQLEYDGLRNAELAWILGRRYNNGGALSDIQRYATQAYAGLGHGVDRFQRMASTAWIEGLIKERLGSLEIKLHTLNIDSAVFAADSSLKMFKPYLTGSNALHASDAVWAHGQVLAEGGNSDGAGGATGFNGAQGQGRLEQGIILGGLSPFLTGMTTKSSLVRFTKAVKNMVGKIDIDRAFGDSAAFSALENEMRRKNLLDWQPDGIVMSKLESPTDEPLSSAELDARNAQLFNIAVSGPAITTAWTSDVRDYKLEVQPQDKLFIVIVATGCYEVSKSANSEYIAVRQKQDAVIQKLLEKNKAAENADQNSNAFDVATSDLEDAISDAEAAARALSTKLEGGDTEHLTAILEVKNAQGSYDSIMNNPNSSASSKKTEEDKLNQAKAKLAELMTAPTKAEVVEMENRVEKMRTQQTQARTTKATLTNFRLMRTTSSHIANYSKYRPGDADSRCGLPISKQKGGNEGYSGCADYIVGGWCIGSTLDSAASRSTVGNLVRTAPTSMAVQANIQVQWWSADKMAKHYADNGDVYKRGEKRRAPPEPEEEEKEAGEDKLVNVVADLDASAGIFAGLEKRFVPSVRSSGASSSRPPAKKPAARRA